MAAEFSIKVEGLAELEDMLEKQAPKVARTALRRSIRKGMQRFAAAISAGAPVYSGPPATRKGGDPVVPGALREGIRVSTMATGGDDDASTGGIVGIVGPLQDLYYALFQEQGTVRQPARPFIRPAFDANAQDVIKVFEDELRSQLEALNA